MLGFIIVAAAVFVALFADVLVPYSPDAINLVAMTRPPAWSNGGSSANLLGTDVLGRDILARILVGSRISLLVGVFSVAAAGFIGTIFGIVAGYYGSWVETVIMRVTDAFHAIPLTLFGMVVLAVVGPGMITMIVVIGITTWPFYARMIRSEVLSLKNQEYVKAARTLGTSSVMTMLRHILPNVMPSFIVVSTLSVANSILAEATLSFLGLGIQPPLVTWGIMLADGRNYIATSWWISTFPGIALSTTVLGIMLLGNWLRDVLDPRNQGLG
ncbi:MAG: ABC transporter permease [Synergistaceae bacterium]|jgi:peptide/nickel transport system permease protein|nr:ABC transporter permease [Synergistaceae bacterium]